MANRRSGRCLCGAITYEVAGDPQMVGICHCRNCQRQAGSSFSLIAGYPSEALFLSGDELTVFQDQGDSGNKVLRKFCNKCGSPILSEIEGQPGTVFVKAGTLDDTSDLVPQFHLWCDSAQVWYQIPEGVPAMPKQ